MKYGVTFRDGIGGIWIVLYSSPKCPQKWNLLPTLILHVYTLILRKSLVSVEPDTLSAEYRCCLLLTGERHEGYSSWGGDVFLCGNNDFKLHSYMCVHLSLGGDSIMAHLNNI